MKDISTLSISSLGKNGRWGNMLFQLFMGIGLADLHDTTLFIPSDWIGLKIFDILTDRVKILDSFTSTAQTPMDYIPTQIDMMAYQNIDLFGYWQNLESLALYSRSKILSWVKFQDWVIRDHLKPDSNLITIHKRRGDYVYQPHLYCSIEDKSFDRIKKQLQDERPYSKIVELTEEHPIIDEYCNSAGIGFLPDFMKMVSSEVVVRSNSTFSFWPIDFSGKTCYAPLVEDKVGWQDVNFINANWPRCADSKYHKFGKLTDLHLKD